MLLVKSMSVKWLDHIANLCDLQVCNERSENANGNNMSVKIQKQIYELYFIAQILKFILLNE